MEQILLNNRYRLIQRIGIGGMAYVYEAEDTLLKRRVAVKILKEQYLEDAEFVNKFENEAQSAASLNHPNIVNIYDVGNEERDGKQLHYIVMELIEGSTLKEAIAAKGKMENEVIVRIAKQIAKALKCAHENKIVHRDIKPANILIMKSGDIKVADFGIARISSSSTITYTNSILGTVHYISPEQAKGRYTDHKSDIYSLGIVMYEMATGKVPFDADNSVGIAIKHIQEEAIPPREINQLIDPGLESIIHKCMEKNPNDRYDSVDDLIYDLSHYKNMDDTVLIKSARGGYAEESVGNSSPFDRSRRIGKNRKRAHKNEEAYYQSRYDQDEDEEEERSGGRWFPVVLGIIALLTILLVVAFFGRKNLESLNEVKTKVPAVVNLSEKEAVKLLEQNELKAKILERVYDAKVDAGQVVEQSIVEGTMVDKGSEIGLKISMGKESVTVPDLRNLTVSEAIERLQKDGFAVGETIHENSQDVEKDRIIRTEPGVGASVEAEARISIIVSDGPEKKKTVVPVLIGTDQDKALEAIRSANLTVGALKTENSRYDVGTVIKQSIKSGEKVDEGTAIDLVVSLGPAISESEEEKTKIYKVNVFPPDGKTSFILQVYDYNKSKEHPIFEETIDATKLNPNGSVTVKVKASSNAKLHFFIDGHSADASKVNKDE